MTTDHCNPARGCITCGDVAVALTVVAAGATGATDPAGVAATAAEARCRDEHGRVEAVAVDLVGPVGPGDRVLVHAGVAIGRLDPVDREVR